MNKYITISIDYINQPDNYTLKQFEETIPILEAMVNSQMFKDFVIKGEYKKKKGLTNQQVYDKFMEQNIHIMMETRFEESDLNRIITVDPDTEVMTCRPQFMKYKPIAEIGAVLLHEYGHNLDFEHGSLEHDSFLGYIQEKGEILLDKFIPKLKRMEYPQFNHWLIYEGEWWNLWLWKKLKFKTIT